MVLCLSSQMIPLVVLHYSPRPSIDYPMFKDNVVSTC
jgi:hypothetical protein